MDALWKFDEPKNVAVFTTDRILRGETAILRVFHDHEDGAWQFLDNGELNNENAKIVGLGEIVELDPSLTELADLPLGWYAVRSSVNGSWTKGKIIS
jgi:hypothetical protein